MRRARRCRRSCRNEEFCGGTDRSGLFVQYVPQIISFAENEICFGVERRADLAESAVAASAFQAVLVPIHVQCFQKIPEQKRSRDSFWNSDGLIGFLEYAMNFEPTI